MNIKGIRVLVVDDDDTLRETLCDALAMEGAQIDEASNGLIAFDKIKTREYDLVLSDVRMPDCSGIDLLNMLKDYDGNTPEIIMMSAFSDLNESEAKKLGAKKIFLKPTKLAEIKSLIEEI